MCDTWLYEDGGTPFDLLPSICFYGAPSPGTWDHVYTYNRRTFTKNVFLLDNLRILGGSHIFDLYQKCFLHNCKMGVIPTISTSLSLHLWLSDDAFSYCSYFLTHNFQIFSYTKFSHIFLRINFTYFLTHSFHTFRQIS